MFKLNIHLFRGISIIFIVFSHCYNVSISSFNQNEHFFAKIFKNLVSGGSAFFVFISGFLFLNVYKSNKKYFDFLLKKIRYVYLPFFFFASFDFSYIIFKIFYNSIIPTSKSQYYWDAIYNFDFISVYFVGGSFITKGILWYVPFIMVVYFLSPIFLFYSKLNINLKIYIFSLSLLTSLFLFRNYSNELVSVFQNVIYFLPFYLLGILTCQNEEYLYLKIKNQFLFILVFISLIIASSKDILPSIIVSRIDLMLFQKLFFCFVFLLSLKKINSLSWGIVKILATYSYGIFFLHTIILSLIRFVTTLLGISFRTDSFLIYLSISTIVLFLSLIGVLIIKRILGSKSKYYIGV
jgi:surface polysaccharide O-acyltransferase-like enzyme